MVPATHSTTKSGQVYYPKYRLLLLVLALLNVAIAIRTVIYAAPLLLILLLIFNAVSMFALGQILRIVISPSGIAYHNSGLYTIETSWTNVVGISNREFPLVGSVQCVILREPAATGWTGLAWMLPPQERGRIIPLSNGWSHQQELEQSIRHHIAASGRGN